ncbi:hypothetical protein EJ08DRAFT_696935 [Tothia fuscella]|uniref:Mob1/phocein n=1 Tax=Tothia fuscella TaxID=1048955 RepID=A0A9P4NSQ7_9PEZI|nr:hypothetical protein EJ08DRAFT_696935 [Tothia fuscella]
MAASPSSSPRLPSPPPIAEDQLGPKSPVAIGPNEQGILAATSFDEGVSRRIRPGTKAAEMPEGPPLIPLKNIDTPFQLTEHLKALYNDAIHPDGSHTVVPLDRDTAIRLSQPPDGVDKSMWLYELCRFLVQKTNSILTGLFSDNPPCSSLTCTEMRASEWQYLCAVHDPPKPCCAIDYCCHTLDWAASTLTSTKNFPSRLSFGPENGSSSQQMRQLTNIFRRVYRIFAHAWFQHRDVFWDVEQKGGLYIFFKTVCDTYNLIPPENYTLPPEAEGIDSTPVQPTKQSTPLIWSRSAAEKEGKGSDKGQGKLAPGSGHPTQRHRHSPSMDSSSSHISTVVEVPEEDIEKSASMEDQGLGLSDAVTDANAGETTEGHAEERAESHEEETASEDSAEQPHQSNSEEASSPEPSEPTSSAGRLTPPSEEETESAPTETTAHDVLKPELKVDQADIGLGEESPDANLEVEATPSSPKEEINDEAEAEDEVTADVTAKEEPHTEAKENVKAAANVYSHKESTDANEDETADETSESSDTTAHTSHDSTSADPSTSTESQSTPASKPTHTEPAPKESEVDESAATKESADDDLASESTEQEVQGKDAKKETEAIVLSDPKADAKDMGEATKSVGD